MKWAWTNPHGSVVAGSPTHTLLRILLAVGYVLLTLGIGIASYSLNFNLSAIGSLYLLTVVFVALRQGFLYATVISVSGVACMNYLFIPPIFEFQISDSENWISLVTFEVTALLVSGLSSKLRVHAAQVELQSARNAKLYDLSRAILLIDAGSSISGQLSLLIQLTMRVDTVELWVAYEDGESLAGKEAAFETFTGEINSDNPELRESRRVLKLGRSPMGAIVLRGWENDASLADTVASLAAVAIERARSLQKESRAEAERNTERLRTAVLDALAHGFKTPLTAIQTASSGLLEIDPQLTSVQAELVAIIDEQAMELSRLATRLLKTGALEANEVCLRRAKVALPILLEDVLRDQPEAIRGSVNILIVGDQKEIEVDAQMLRIALLQLIDNAAKYSVAGGAIEVTVTLDDLETTIEVANIGSSIRPEELERVFERFYRGIDAVHGPRGTGLGLSIVKKTAEAHGGRAWAESKENKTRVFFTVKHNQGVTHG